MTEYEVQAFHKPAIDSARKMILVSGLFYPLAPVLLFAVLGHMFSFSLFLSSGFALLFGIGLAVFGAHVALWWWAQRQPFFASLIALGIFLATVIWQGDIASGFIIKAVVVFTLGRAVIAGHRVHKLRSRSLQPA